MGNGDPLSQTAKKKKEKMVKVERVNFLGSEVWGISRCQMGSCKDARVEGGRKRQRACRSGQGI